MPPENVRVRKENRHFTFVVVPSGDAKQTRTFSVSKWKLVVSAFALFFVISAAVFALLAYTPVRYLLPVSNPELERKYGKQILEIREQLSHITQEMTVLRGYNLKLRKALGETVAGADSSLAASAVAPGPGSGVTPAGTIAEPTGRAEQQVPAPESRQLMTFAPGNEPAGDRQSAVRSGKAIDLPLVSPAEGYITRGFDTRHYHYGTDFAGKKSSGVLSAADGSVVFSGWTYNDGFMIMVAHDRGYLTVYKHNEALLKSTGSAVKRGELIALLGSTGKTSSGPHLHFEVWKDGIAYDPEKFLLAK